MHICDDCIEQIISIHDNYNSIEYIMGNIPSQSVGELFLHLLEVVARHIPAQKIEWQEEEDQSIQEKQSWRMLMQ